MFSGRGAAHAVQVIIDASYGDALQDLLRQLGDVERIVGRIGIATHGPEIWTNWRMRWG